MKQLYSNRFAVKFSALSLLFFSFCFAPVKAQLAFTRTNFNGTFTAITTGGGASTSTAAGDDAVQVGIPIGFTFNYLGTPFTTVQVSTNGWLSFNATAVGAVPARNNANLYTAVATSTTPNTVAPYWDDLSSPSILFQTQGLPGAQTFTVQWNANSFFSGGKAIQFQVILYEGSNIIEFRYGTATGTMSLSESASIGLCNAAGGVNNYLDALTGSSNTGQYYMSSQQWPNNYFFRFTPGLPTAIAGGTYSVGVGQTYRNLSEAVADINHRGITGAVTLDLADATYDTTVAGGANIFPILLGVVNGNSVTNTITLSRVGSPANIRWGGCGPTGCAMANQASTAVNTTSAEFILGLCGTDYVTVDNVMLSGNIGSRRLNFGVGVFNSSATDGATNNTFRNFSIISNRNLTTSRGIFQSTITTPTAASGSNSGNTYLNFDISNVYAGVQLTGNATFPDVNTQVGTTVCTNFNNIGSSATPNDIGNNTTQTYGILATNQSGVKIFNNYIRNVTNTGGQADGIFLQTFQGVSEVYNNKIQSIRNAGTGSTTIIAGIRASHATTGTHTARIYNNTVTDINSGYTGAATATRTLRGIFISGTGGGATQTYEIFDNSVNIDGSSSPNLSSSAFEVASATGPAYIMGNNIFSNFTAAQTGVAAHYAIVSPSATAFGNTGTTSNNNNFYVPNGAGVSGFTGLGATTAYATVANWTAGITGNPGLETASIAVDPVFTNATDLHISSSALNGTGLTPPAYITNDLDCAVRTPDNDMGAYIINSCAGTPTAGNITGVASICSGAGTTLNLTGASSGSGITYQWMSSTTSGGPYTNLGTSGSQPTGSLTTTTYYVVAVNCAFGGSAQTAEFTLNVLPIPSLTVTPNTATYCSPGTGVALNATGASTYAWAPATGLSATTGASVTATPAANTTYTVTGTGANGCTSTATASVTSAANVIVTNVSATPTNICAGGNSQLNVSTISAGTVNTYAFATSTGASLDPMTGATQVINSSNDDTPNGTPLNIGFPFIYEGVTYNQYSVSPDGWLLLGGATAANQFTNAITSATNIPKIYPYWDDLATGTTGHVRTLVTGTAPNRIFKVQWFVTIPRVLTNPANSTFQAWLYETTGVIEFRYGTLGTATMSSSVGLTGATPTNFNCVTVSTNANSVVTANNTNAGQPASGRMYTFTPPSASTILWSPTTFIPVGAETTTNPLATGVTSSTTYTVTASNAGSCPATGTVTVNAGVPLACPSITLSAGTICSASNFTLTANTTGGGTPLSYVWSDGVGGVYPDAATITANLAAGTYNFSVTVTDPCGGSCSATLSVTVNSTPVVTVTPPSGTLCLPGGLPIDLTASGASTYAWAPATGLSATTGANVTANPASSQTYTVTGTSAAGCISTATVPITVAPAITITDVTASPTSVCTGGTSTLAATAVVNATYCTPNYTNLTTSGDFVSLVNLNGMNNATGGAAALPNYTLFTTPTTTLTAGTAYTITVSPGTWTSNDIGVWIDYNQDGVFTNAAPEKIGQTINMAAMPATTTYTFTVPLTALNGTTRLRVRDADQATAVIDPCTGYTFGETEDYVITITGGSPSFTYVWSESPSNGTLTSTTANPTTATNITTTETYTVIATSIAGCSDTGSVSVGAGIPLACSPITLGSPTICSGTNFTLTVNTTGGGSPLTYTWSDGVGGVYPNAATITANLAAGTYNFSVTVTDPCSGSCTSTLTVTVDPSPSVTVTPLTATICNPGGSPVSLTASGAVTYAWTPATGLSATTGANVTASPAATTVYTVTGTAANGCTGTATATINVGPNPVISSITATPSVVCPNGTTTLDAMVLTGQTYCTPNYTNLTTSGDFVSLVTLNGLNNATGGAPALPNYTLFTTPTTTLANGSTYTITVSPGTWTSNDIGVWIDYNNDGVFTDAAPEKIGQTLNMGAMPATTSFTFTVPLTAMAGPTRLRVRDADQGSLNVEPCTGYTFGETEDYIITLTGGTPVLTYAWTESPNNGTLISPATLPSTTGPLTVNETYTLTVTSAIGCTSTATTNVSVGDITAPTITCPADVTVTTDAGSCFATGVALGTPVTVDNCSVASVTNNAPAAFPVGTTVVNWTVTDGSGNIASCAQLVTVNDTEVPTILCPATANITTDPGMCSSTASIGTPATSDNCSVASVTNNAPASFPVGTTMVTWTVIDASGNSATCTQQVNVTDVQGPVIVCPADVTAGTDPGSCTASGVALGTPTVTDNCAVAFFTNNAPGTYFIGANTVTWTAIDIYGNMSTCVQTVTIADMENPTIACPANITVTPGAGSCSATGVALGSPTTADNCGVASVTNNAPAVYNGGVTNVTWTVTDFAGNTSTCVQTVTVIDNQNPTITCPAAVTASTDAGSCFATVTLATPVTADNCSVASVTNNAPATFAVGTTTVTWTVTDASGNTATCTQTVTVTDGENPTIICPADITVNADAGVCTASGVALGTPVTADNCSVASITNDAPAAFMLGINPVIWTVTDANGNASICVQNVTVIDTQNPVIVCPGDVTVNANAGSCVATGVALGTASATDNCSVGSITNNAPASFPIGVTSVTWTATDGDGNSSTCIQTVTVIDNQNPTITCPANVTAVTDAGMCTASGVALGLPVTSDNCSVASVTNNAPATYPVGVTAVTWTVTDASGNTSTCVQTVTITDNQLPTIVCPAAVTGVADASLCTSSTIVLGTPVTSDNCTVASVTNNAPAAFPVGVTTVTWTVTDAGGNTATCAQTVTVTDTEAPVAIGCPGNINITTNNTGCTGIATWVAPTASDNCTGSVTITSTHNSGAVFPVGTTTVTYTFTDGSGNASTCSFTVTVTNNLSVSASPVAVLCNGTATGVINLTVTGGSPAYTFDWDNDGTGDNDDAEDLSAVMAGTYTVIVTDASGCSATTSATITQPTALSAAVTTTTNPTACGTANGAINITVSGGVPGYVFDWNNDGTGDNDDAEDLTGVVSGLYTVVVTDANGCQATTSASLTDPNGPVVTITAVNDALCNGDNNGSINTSVSLTGTATSYTVLWDDLFSTTTDNISNLSVGTYTIVVTDNNGCIGSASATIGQPAVLTATAVPADVSCNGSADGSIDVTTTGGTAGYLFDWDNDGVGDNDDTEDIAGLAPGTYNVMITDANGCAFTTMVTIAEPAVITSSAVITNTSCTTGASDGSINHTTSGGTAPYTYSWSNGSVTEDISGLAAGSYTVTVTDDNGCTTTGTYSISTAQPVVFSFSSTLCAGNSITVGSNTYNSSGTYTNVFTAANGCDSTVILNLTVNPPVNVNTSTSAFTITALSTSGNYEWLDCNNGMAPVGATTQTFAPTVDGDYAVRVVEMGCPDTSSCVNVTGIGIQEVMADLFKIYPNPSAGLFTIESPVNAKLQVLNSVGEIIQNTTIYLGKNQLNLDNVACGPYVMRVTSLTTGEVLVTERLLIQK